jgi:hypothetical protein
VDGTAHHFSELTMRLSLPIGFVVVLISCALMACGQNQPARPVVINPEQPPNRPKVLEPAAFWTSIANDEKQEHWRRGMALYFLFEKHFRKDMTLRELGKTLSRPSWIKEENVSKIGAITGALPLGMEFGLEDSMFEINVFPISNAEKNDNEHLSIYISVFGRLNTQEFLSVIRDQEENKQSTNRIKAFVVTPYWNEYNDYIRPVLPNVLSLLESLRNIKPTGVSTGVPGLILVHNEITTKIVAKGSKVVPLLLDRLENCREREAIYIIFCLHELKAKMAKPAIESLKKSIEAGTRFQEQSDLTLLLQIRAFLRDVDGW